MELNGFSDETIWELDIYSNVREALLDVLNSFQPTSYASTQYGYAMAHPRDWETYGIYYDPDEMDYNVYSRSDDVDIFTYVNSAVGYRGVFEYGEAALELDSRYFGGVLLYSGRVNPGYRIEYETVEEGTGRIIRGAYLITLYEDNALWVEINTYEENWFKNESLVNDIFLRVAVAP